MATLTNSFEGGSSGTTIIAGNSGGSSGTAFNTVQNTTMTALEFSNAQRAHGSLSAHLNGPNTSLGRLQWTGLNTTQAGGYFYFRFNGSLPGAAQDIFTLRSTGAGAMTVGLSVGNLVQVKNALGTTLNSGGWTVPSFSGSVWYRLNFSCIPNASTTAGTITAELYLADSTVAISGCTYSASNVNAGTANIDEMRVGKLTSAVVLEMYVDNLAIATGTTTPPALPADPVAAASSSIGTSTATVVPTQNVAAASSSTGTPSAAVVPSQNVSAASSSTGTATATVLPGFQVTATASGAGTGTASPTPQVAAATSGAGGSSATVTPGFDVTAGASGAGAATATVLPGYPVAASSSGTGTLSGSAVQSVAVSAASSGVGTASVSVVPTQLVTAAASGEGTADVSISAGHSVTATSSSTGTASAEAIPSHAVVAEASSEGTATARAFLPPPNAETPVMSLSPNLARITVARNLSGITLAASSSSDITITSPADPQIGIEVNAAEVTL